MKQRKRNGRNRSLVVLLFCLLALVACAAPAAQPEAASAGAPATRDRLVIGVPFLTEILDGQQSYDGGLESVEQIGQALLRLDAKTGALIPDLAESWSFSADGKTLTVKLPAGAVYANGDPLDAQAVKDAWLRNKEVSPYASDFAALTDVKVVDATTVEAIFSDPPAAFLTVLSTSFGGPWNAAAAKAVGNEAFAAAPVASGPLMVKEFTPGSELLLVRNEKYQTRLPLVQNKGPLHLAEVLVRMIPEEVTLVGELETGAIDLVVNAPASAIERLRNNPEIQIFEVRKPGVVGLLMNLQQPTFADLRVRQAIAKAIDRDALVKVLPGAAPVRTFITPGMVAYSAEAESYAQQLHPLDVAAAQALLAEAGWADSDGDGIVEKEGQPFTVEFLIATGAIAQEQASQVIQSQLKAIGIDVQIRQQEGPSVREQQLAGEYDLGFEIYNWPDPDILSVVFGADFWNYGHYDNPALIAEMAAARYLLDPAERTAAYTKIQQQLIDDVAQLPLWQGTLYIAARSNVQGFLITDNVQIYLNDVTVVE